jgi:hypothetical protein
MVEQFHFEQDPSGWLIPTVECAVLVEDDGIKAVHVQRYVGREYDVVDNTIIFNDTVRYAREAAIQLMNNLVRQEFCHDHWIVVE